MERILGHVLPHSAFVLPPHPPPQDPEIPALSIPRGPTIARPQTSCTCPGFQDGMPCAGSPPALPPNRRNHHRFVNAELTMSNWNSSAALPVPCFTARNPPDPQDTGWRLHHGPTTGGSLLLQTRSCGKTPIVIIPISTRRSLFPVSSRDQPGNRSSGVWQTERVRPCLPEWIPTGDLPCGAATARVKYGR
jgi:hypothetical protein